jgi:sugar/nucleoside kinase (ribokinase family)
VFLANIDPLLQSDVLSQVKAPKFVMMDTMNLWIQMKKETIFQLIKKADLFVLNEKEAKLLTGDDMVYFLLDA